MSENNQSEHKEHEDHDKLVTIIINARAVKVDKNSELSYRDVVILSEGQYDENPDVVYTVTYTKDREDKSHDLVDGGKPVKVKEGMAFNVSKTDKS